MIVRRLAGLVVLLSLVTPVVRANTATVVPAGFTSDPLAWFVTGGSEETVRYAAAVTADPATSSATRTAAWLAEGSVHVAKGRAALARAAFMRILAEDPTADVAQPDRVPAPALRMFYRLRDSVCTAGMETLAKDGRLASDLRTIAVGDLENNSIVTGDYDMDRFSKGLVHMLMRDLMGGTPLKVVDRQRLAVLRDEIGMARDKALTDPASRVRLGQLTGAQTYLFGSVMLREKGLVTLELRWVETATSEVLASETVEGRITSSEDIMKLQRRLLLDVMAPRIEAYLEKAGQRTPLRPALERWYEDRMKDLPSGKLAYGKAVVAAGAAVASEDAGDAAAAATAWSDVARATPSDRGAATRAAVLASYDRARSEDAR